MCFGKIIGAAHIQYHSSRTCGSVFKSIWGKGFVPRFQNDINILITQSIELYIFWKILRRWTQAVDDFFDKLILGHVLPKCVVDLFLVTECINGFFHHFFTTS